MRVFSVGVFDKLLFFFFFFFHFFCVLPKRQSSRVASCGTCDASAAQFSVVSKDKCSTLAHSHTHTLALALCVNYPSGAAAAATCHLPLAT